MKKILLLFFCAATLSGASVDFRGGRVLCAELSSRCPAEVQKIDPLLYPDLPENKIYAALTVFCHPGRTLSVFDYSIDFYGKLYPCIAIKEDNKPFSFDVKRDYQGSPRKKYTLLFILNRNFLSSSGVEKLDLKANFPPEQRSKQVLPFRMLGDRNFTAPGAIPASGLMPEK